MRRKVLKHVNDGLMRQFMTVNNCHSDKVKSMFGVPGGGLKWPKLMMMDMGRVCEGGLEQYLRVSIGNYVVDDADDDNSLVNFRFSQLNKNLRHSSIHTPIH